MSLGPMPVRSRSAVTGPASSSVPSAPVDERLASLAEKTMRDGEALCQTTWYRWKPDYDDAAIHFDRAASQFLEARAPRQAAAAYARASDVAELQNAFASAGHYLEKSAKLLAGQSALLQHQAIAQYEKAGQLFADGGNLPHAATTLLAGAKLATSLDPPAAIRLYTRALDVYEMSEREKLGAQALKDAMALAVKIGDWAAVARFLDKEQAVAAKYNQTVELNRCFLARIIVALHQTDFIAADRHYYEALKVKEFAGSPEYRVAAQLLEAAEQASEEKYAKIAANQLLSFLDPEIYRLARTIPIREFTPVQPQPVQQVEDFLSSVAVSSSSARMPATASYSAAASSSSSSSPQSIVGQPSRRTGYQPGEDSPPSSPESEHRPLLDPPSSAPAPVDLPGPAAPADSISDDDESDDDRPPAALKPPVIEHKAPIFLNAGDPLPSLGTAQPALPTNLDDLC